MILVAIVAELLEEYTMILARVLQQVFQSRFSGLPEPDLKTRQIHARKNCNLKTVQKLAEEIYGKFAPFQYLAYWFELWKYYEEEFGNLSALSPDAYRIVTGSTSNRGKGKRRNSDEVAN